MMKITSMLPHMFEMSVIIHAIKVKMKNLKYAFRGSMCRDGRIRIDNTRLFLPPPTTTLMTSDVVVNQLVLFTMLQSFFRIPGVILYLLQEDMCYIMDPQ